MVYKLAEMNRSGMPPLLDGSGNLEYWESKRRRIMSTWSSYIGELPDRPPVNMRVSEESRQAGHKRLHIQYDTVYGDTVTAYLLLPEDQDGRLPAGKLPAVIALHPTSALGKDVIADDVKAKANRNYALELVRRGYVVLAPDAMTAGERIFEGCESFVSGPFYAQHPEWSTVAKNVTDHRQGVDVLAELDIVDSERIGAIGHSFGGYNAYFLGMFDERVKAMAASCGVSPFYLDPNPGHWGIREGWYTHLPAISKDLALDEVPFDFHEIIALAAPSPIFLYAGQEDHIFPHWQSVGATMIELKSVYRLYNKENDFTGLLGTGGHDFPPSIRELAYQFLDRYLR